MLWHPWEGVANLPVDELLLFDMGCTGWQRFLSGVFMQPPSGSKTGYIGGAFWHDHDPPVAWTSIQFVADTALNREPQ